ncbi:MAG: hypothetical protein NTZ65_03935 [Candidatus Berkelbacteria bacterium]|nr:hypothetical protein [Candidatus Berkelbacteria bacterium]
MTERARGYYADPILVGTPSNPGESELVTGQLEIKMAGWYRTWYPAEGVALFEGNTPLVVLASPGLKVERSESGYRISAGSAREGWISAIFAADKDRAIWTLCFRVQFTGP